MIEAIAIAYMELFSIQIDIWAGIPKKEKDECSRLSPSFIY
ncbi:hypothetical protein SRABI96_04248 [Peribacillus sp. Bi96]|nr:hypothetical protein SRABI96_04248 [Peribacillus sp. Bi96]